MAINVAEYEAMVQASTPGRLEGEGPATAYYYEAMLNGDGEPHGLEGDVHDVFKVTDEEREAFELDGPYYAIHTSYQGFVCGEDGITAADLDTFDQASEEAADDAE